MAIASFANKVFTVDASKIYTFDKFQYSSALQIEKQDAAGKKPSSYNKGPDLDTIRFTIPLNVEFGINPRNEWGSWKALLQQSIAYPFILGGIPLNNAKWLLTDVSPNKVIFDNEGKILSLELNLEFQEYVRAGSAKAKEDKSARISISPGLLLGDSSYGNIYSAKDTYTGGGFGPEDKSQYKRVNGGMIPR